MALPAPAVNMSGGGRAIDPTGASAGKGREGMRREPAVGPAQMAGSFGRCGRPAAGSTVK